MRLRGRVLMDGGNQKRAEAENGLLHDAYAINGRIVRFVQRHTVFGPVVSHLKRTAALGARFACVHCRNLGIVLRASNYVWRDGHSARRLRNISFI